MADMDCQLASPSWRIPEMAMGDGAGHRLAVGMHRVTRIIPDSLSPRLEMNCQALETIRSYHVSRSTIVLGTQKWIYGRPTQVDCMCEAMETVTRRSEKKREISASVGGRSLEGLTTDQYHGVKPTIDWKSVNGSHHQGSAPRLWAWKQDRASS